MSRRRVLVCLATGLALLGCATTPRVPEPETPPKEAETAPPGESVQEQSLGEAIRPQQAEVHVAEARQALAVRDYRRAAEAARSAAAADPENTEATLVEAQAREAMGDLPGALHLWERLVGERAGGNDSLISYASLAVRRGRGEAAWTRLQERVREAPDDPEIRGVAGWVPLQLGRPTEAREHLETTWDTPSGDRYAMHLARARFIMGDLDAAAVAAERGARARPSVSSWVLLGDVRRSLGLAAAAERAYQEALERDPDSYPAQVNLGVLKLSQGETLAAAELFAAAAEARPGAPDAWNDLGLARRAEGDLERAREAYERALAASPDYPPALKNLAILSEKYLGRPDVAVAYYDRYLEARPEDEEVSRWRKIAERQARSEASGDP